MQGQIKKNCRMCRGTSFKEVLNMGNSPLVNSLIEKKDFNKIEVTFPLIVEQCQDCYLVQIVNPIDSKQIYKDVDYLYFSGDMPGLQNYFKDYADELTTRFLNPGDFVVEIGSNDGTMLSLFPKWTTKLGIDPASNVVVRALNRGINTVSDFFTERLAKSIKREFGKARIIYGNNCIAHLDDLHDLMKGVSSLLQDGGMFVVECNYWGGMVQHKNYSLIYHDHFSYFSLKNWVDFVPQFGLQVYDAVVTPAQGGSLRVFIVKDQLVGMTKQCEKLLHEEIRTSLNGSLTAKKFGGECKEEAYKLYNQVVDLKQQGKKIAGYGAAAKGFSILQLAGIGKEHIDYFVDDSPAKQGKYTPVERIPVISREESQNILPDVFIITAPNYADIIINKEQEFINNGGTFIVPKNY